MAGPGESFKDESTTPGLKDCRNQSQNPLASALEGPWDEKPSTGRRECRKNLIRPCGGFCRYLGVYVHVLRWSFCFQELFQQYKVHTAYHICNLYTRYYILYNPASFCTEWIKSSTPVAAFSKERLRERVAVHMGGCQNYGPLLDTLNTRCRIIIGTQKGTTKLTTTHMGKKSKPQVRPIKTTISGVFWTVSKTGPVRLYLALFCWGDRLGISKQ